MLGRGFAMTKPKSLGTRGGRFWDEVTAVYRLNVDELELLAELCRTLDTIDALAGQEPTVDLARELRLQRGELRHLTSALGLPDEAGRPAVESGNTKRARRAAEVRWSRDKEADDG